MLLWCVDDSLPYFTEVILPKLQLPPSPPRTPPPRMDQPLLPSEYIRKKKKEPVLGNFRSLFVSLVLTQIRLVPVHTQGQNWLREMKIDHVLLQYMLYTNMFVLNLTNVHSVLCFLMHPHFGRRRGNNLFPTFFLLFLGNFTQF